MATLADDAVMESNRVDVSLSGEPFVARGNRVVSAGWFEYYPYSRQKDLELPLLHEGDLVQLVDKQIDARETQPPARYGQGPLIEFMEKHNLGTKATRHSIIQNLYDRGYVHGNPVEPTEMGIKLAEALQEYAPRIASPEMTAELEKDMDLISERDLTKEQVVTISRDLLREAYGSLEQNRQQVASKIYEGITDDRILGDCPKCGTNRIRVIRSKATKKRFVGCEGYPDCDQTYPLPQRGDIIGTGEICPQCGSPKIKVLGGRRPWVLCLDPYCPTKAEYREKKAARASKAEAGGESRRRPPPRRDDRSRRPRPRRRPRSRSRPPRRPAATKTPPRRRRRRRRTTKVAVPATVTADEEPRGSTSGDGRRCRLRGRLARRLGARRPGLRPQGALHHVRGAGRLRQIHANGTPGRGSRRPGLRGRRDPGAGRYSAGRGDQGHAAGPTSPRACPRGRRPLLYAAARAHLVEQVIRPALEDGQIVLCDRYIDSSLAYQGYGRGLGSDYIMLVNDWGTNGLYPDLTLFLDLDDSVRSTRLAAVPDRLEAEDDEFHRRVAQGYRELLLLHRHRIRSVDATGSEAEVQERVRAIIEQELELFSH